MAELFQEWLKQNQFDRAYFPEIVEKLYFEGDLALRKLTSYFVLVLLATVIATFGVTSASTATVIGAMLVAPLMTPIMGTTLALSMGNGSRAVRSILLVLVSVAAVIGLAALLSFAAFFVDFESNPEITSRVQPGLAALVVALAAGATGAFATTRKSVGDSLPGVAIAISLVPPLSVGGIALAHGRFDDAFGALLLFVTNFLAIILAGSVVFWVSGANAVTLSRSQAEARKRAYLIALTSAVVVTLLLGGTTFEAYRNEKEYNLVQQALAEWLSGSSYETISTLVRKPNVTITLAGEGDLPPVEQLGKNLQSTFGPALVLQVKARTQENVWYPEAPISD
ncbi:MAG: TIGR00341 family protein [Chloroflexota bacterium]